MFSQVSVMQTTLISLIFVTAHNSSILPFNDRTLVTRTVCKKTFSRSVVRGLHGSIQLFGRSTISFNNAWVVLLECPSGEAYYMGIKMWVSHSVWGNLKIVWGLSVKRRWKILLLVWLKELLWISVGEITFRTLQAITLSA